MLVVMALGGRVPIGAGGRVGGDDQQAWAREAARASVAIAAEHHLVLAHGDGSVGWLSHGACARVAADTQEAHPAETGGADGRLLEEALARTLPRDLVATLLTRVEVDPDDPAFARPTEPVGPHYDFVEAERLARAHGWSTAPNGDGWRRVVPSPRPRSIVELPALRILVDHGVTVVCAGVGNLPVAPTPAGGLRPVEAVIDEDLAAARLAVELDADALLLTGMAPGGAVDADGDGAGVRSLHEATVEELRDLPLPAGSLVSKVEAACSFIEQGGWLAGIGSVSDAPAMLRGEAGTVVWGSDARAPAVAAASASG